MNKAMTKTMTKKARKIVKMGPFPISIARLTKSVVDSVFEDLRGGDIVVEGGLRELKAEVFNRIREEALENAEYASADKATIKAILLIARLKAERKWRQFRIDLKQVERGVAEGWRSVEKKVGHKLVRL